MAGVVAYYCAYSIAKLDVPKRVGGNLIKVALSPDGPLIPYGGFLCDPLSSRNKLSTNTPDCCLSEVTIDLINLQRNECVSLVNDLLEVRYYALVRKRLLVWCMLPTSRPWLWHISFVNDDGQA